MGTRNIWLIACLLLGSFLGSGCKGESTATEIVLEYDEASNLLKVGVTRDLVDGESLHVRLRQGVPGVLNCTTMLSELDQIDGNEAQSEIYPAVFAGPTVEAALFEKRFGPEALEDEYVPEDPWLIDGCLMNGSEVVVQAELDLSRGLDRPGSDGKFDNDDEEVRVNSIEAYAELCEAELGEIPFFEKLSDGDYSTFNCLDAVPIPMTVTDAAGETTYPTERPEKCDQQQYIYSSCEPNAVDGVSNGPRVTRRTNEQGTDFVLLCRKSKGENSLYGNGDEGFYGDIAMIGHNPFTGKTCYYQGLGNLDGTSIPHPADTVNSTESDKTANYIWSGVHGGLGSGIRCVNCHDADPFINTPWIDGAKFDDGTTVVPRIGEHENYPSGANDAPYSIVNLEGQGWTMPKSITGEKAAACTSCHRMGDGRWAADWLDRLEGEDTGWNDDTTAEFLKGEHLYWMPPNAEMDEATWESSEFKEALDFIQSCKRGSDNGECGYRNLPTSPLGEGEIGELPEIDLEGSDLALAALKAVGAKFEDPSCEGGDCGTRRCAECHSTSRVGLRHWADLTNKANRTCNLDTNPDDMTAAEALEAVNCMKEVPSDPSSVFEAAKIGMYAAGVQFAYFPKLFQKAYSEVADPDGALVDFVNTASDEELLAVVGTERKRDLIVDGRPYDSLQDVDDVPGIGQATIDKIRNVPASVPTNNWLVEYVKFKNRVNMPKGSHPKFTSEEYATIIKWFDQDLPNLDERLPEPTAPSNCVDSISPAMLEHIDEMKFEGWRAANADNGIRMFGCDNAISDLDCYKDEETRDDWNGPDALGDLKVVRTLDFRTSFWMRTSADGRFIGNGGGSNGFRSTVTDMVRDMNINIKASYDPGFFPDNSGFMWQGGGAGICAQSILETAESVDFTEPECIKAQGINLYQHVARGIDGDYFIINSQFTSDSGNEGTSTNPRANFGPDGTMKFSPMVFNGTTYEQLDPVVVETPFEGDSVLSPSSRLVISRIAGGEGKSIGFNIRKVVATQLGSNYTINVDEEVATVCMDGAKANISFDERFVVTHAYEEDGTANIWLFDLTDGSRHQITDMPEGFQALFPHFLSNNWFHFLVKGPDIDGEAQRYAISSNSALVLENL